MFNGTVENLGYRRDTPSLENANHHPLRIHYEPAHTEFRLPLLLPIAKVFTSKAETAECLSPESRSPVSPALSRSNSYQNRANTDLTGIRIKKLALQVDKVRNGGSLPLPTSYASGYIEAEKLSPKITQGAPRLHKRLIICCDGTWKNGLSSAPSSATNVLKLSRCIYPEDRRTFPPIPQVVFYQSGLGTTDGPALDLAQGATGAGILAKIREAYAFIAQNYIPGDEVFLFGFSRGAFTARTIASLIGDLGILSSAGMADFHQVLAAYQVRFEGTERSESAEKFLDNYRQGGTKHMCRMAEGTLKCVGVWDTVGALGLPGFFDQNFNLLGFRDTKLSHHIKYAFHAMAVHETRKDFTPTKWVKTHTPSGLKKYPQVLKQVWFPGSHSDVGGGYAHHDLSDISLIWMVANLMKYNLLAIDEDYLNTLPAPQAEWGKQAPHDPRQGVMSTTLKTVRQFPTVWDEKSMETIHPSVFRQETLAPQLAEVFADNTPRLLEKLLPFEEKMRIRWDALLKENKIQSRESVYQPNPPGRMLFTDLLKTFNGLLDIGRFSLEIVRGQSTDEEVAEKMLLEE
ncbi:hypothetical protein Pst134EB_004555 [Puccinia striiformis f. sp. tritici]|uniref:T6SS Phospholipase effector Tle1-like catalytic domain-containing protein n=1 Tax=Puccinia striiformis f. sp. tritici PST-78 TaxID=1165861 RepID=A0A0L0URH3_9BASI|nr:hypothetical protein Pst134EB_004555 [Puccinia striiformis f. sp. tritici]KNE89682.1 hypothetical protein PSTG_16845 [Puccinia striiformis f. sp. tritici PST-78]